MKIGVNARLLVKPNTGIGQYTKNLFSNLEDDENEYILFVPGEVDEEVLGCFGKNVRVEVLAEGRRGSAGIKKTWWEQISIPEAMKKEKVDIAFFTYPSLPWTGVLQKAGIKTAVTVHDCIPWKDSSYRRGILSKMYHSQTRRALKRADLVLTVSNYSKEEIVKYTQVNEEKIEVIYNDAGEEYKKVENGGEVLERFGLVKGKYLLYVGGYDKRKNVKGLLRQYFEMADMHDDINLVLAGEKLFADKLYESFEEKNTGSGKVIKTGFLSEADLGSLYCGALAFVNLSKEEGFNIPVLEAANCSVPIVLSDIPVHREIAGESALFVDNDLGACVTKLLKDREFWLEKAAKLAGKFSWKSSAKKFVNVLNSLGKK